MSEVAIAVRPGWEAKRLDEVADILDNLRIPVNSKERDSRQGPVPYFGATGQVGWIDDHIFDEEIVLLGEDGAPFLDSTKQKAYVVRGKSWVNNHAHVLRAKEGIPSLYLKYWLDRLDYKPYVNGTTRLKLTQGEMRRIPIPLAPECERYEIVAELEKQFSRLDEAVANLQHVKANLKRYKASVLKDAVEGRLVPLEAELARREGRSFETGKQLLQRILDTRRSQWIGKGKFKCSVTPDIDELHALPQGWAWCATDQVCEKITDGEHISPNIVPDGIPLLSAKDVLHIGVTFEDAKYVTAHDAEKFRSRCDPDRGDILIVSRGATIGRACRVNSDRVFCLMGSVILMKPAPLVEAGYLMLALKAGFFLTRLTAVSGSTAQQAIYIRDVRPLQLPLPPLAEQQRIAAEVDRLLSLVLGVEAEVDANLKRAQSLRQAVLARSFASSSH